MKPYKEFFCFYVELLIVLHKENYHYHMVLDFQDHLLLFNYTRYVAQAW